MTPLENFPQLLFATSRFTTDLPDSGFSTTTFEKVSEEVFRCEDVRETLKII